MLKHAETSKILNPTQKRKPSFQQKIPKGLNCQWYENTLTMWIISMVNLISENSLTLPKPIRMFFEYLHSPTPPKINHIIYNCLQDHKLVLSNSLEKERFQTEIILNLTTFMDRSKI